MAPPGLSARRIVLVAKLVLSVAEVLLGIVLLAAAIGHVDIGSVLRHGAIEQLRRDPGDVVATQVVRRVPGLKIAAEAELGGAAVLLTRPTPLRLALGALDLAVAVAIAMEARTVLRQRA